MINRFIRKPEGEWQSEQNFRIYQQISNAGKPEQEQWHITNSQQFYCLTCGRKIKEFINKACNWCGSKNFCKSDFTIRGEFPGFIDGEIHSKQKVELKDIETDRQLINAGIIPIRIKNENIEKAIALQKKT